MWLGSNVCIFFSYFALGKSISISLAYIIPLVQSCGNLTLFTGAPAPEQIALLDEFFVPDKLKSHVLKCFATGFISHFEYPPPKP